MFQTELSAPLVFLNLYSGTTQLWKRSQCCWWFGANFPFLIGGRSSALDDRGNSWWAASGCSKRAELWLSFGPLSKISVSELVRRSCCVALMPNIWSYSSFKIMQLSYSQLYYVVVFNKKAVSTSTLLKSQFRAATDTPACWLPPTRCV